MERVCILIGIFTAFLDGTIKTVSAIIFGMVTIALVQQVAAIASFHFALF